MSLPIVMHLEQLLTLPKTDRPLVGREVLLSGMQRASLWKPEDCAAAVHAQIAAGMRLLRIRPLRNDFVGIWPKEMMHLPLDTRRALADLLEKEIHERGYDRPEDRAAIALWRMEDVA